MLPYETIELAEGALGRKLSCWENLWFRFSAKMLDIWLYFHTIWIVLIVFSMVPLPLFILELVKARGLQKYKIQPKIYTPKLFIGIRTSLPLPSLWEVIAQLTVYFLVEDSGHYWIHRWLHCKWGYDKIHRIHHGFTAPIGFAAPYAHWAEVLLLGIPTFVGPAIAPGHLITYWLWIALRQMEAIDTHSGY
ncbi:hypothetical protein SUGI_0599790 [Cryptomeria japonica]|nr:hypothetical protein SUGI_0599790 [Cryptomeria japonica]